MNHQIVRTCADPAGNDRKNPHWKEWVQIEVGRSGVLTGFVLQHLANPGKPNQHWANLYTVRDTTVFKKDDLVFFHSGGGRDGWDTNGAFHYYAAGASGIGNWKLNNDGDAVRLNSPSGETEDHAKIKAGQCDLPKVKHGGGVVVTPAPSFCFDGR